LTNSESPRATGIRRGPVLAALAAVGLFAVLFFQQASAPYVMDEAEFPLVAKGIADTGRPVYYRGEDLAANLGIWHPPLYQYTLGIWESVFGPSHVAVRVYGLVCFLTAAAFGALLIRRLFPERGAWLAALWTVLFLVHPYAVESALLPDIDSTVLVALTAICFWLVGETLVRRRWSPTSTAAAFGVVVGLAFLAKLTTPFALFAVAVTTIALATRSVRQTVAGASMVAGVAAVLFGVVWGGIAWAANLSFTYPFTFTYTSATTRSSAHGLRARLNELWPTTPVMFWMTPLLLALFVVGLLVALRRIRTPAAQVVLIAAAYSVVVFFVYNEITGPPFGFPKYYAPALAPAILVALAPFGLVSRVPLLRAPLTPVRVGAAIAFLVVLVAVSRIEYARRALLSTFPARPVWFVALIAVVLLAVVVALARPGDTRISGWGVVGLAALVGAAAVMWAGQSLYQEAAPGSVRYYPGERDEAVTIEKVRELLLSRGALEDARLVSAKDIGYESGVRYYEDALYLPHLDRLRALLQRSPRKIIVTRADYDYSQIVWPAAFALIRKLARPIWVSPTGTFTIWEAKRRPATS
jgi:4-amino-4-deoxy-L-arabinose transferase-like glycosyltransferase